MISRLRGAIFGLAGAAALLAQDADTPWTFRGFATLAASRSDTGQASFLGDLSQYRGIKDRLDLREESRLGLQVSGPLGETLRGTLQVVSKSGYDGSFRPQLTWAFLGWDPTPDLELRGGRLGFDVFMNADSRDVGYSFLWVRPPADYYGTLPISHLDGLDLTQTLRFEGFQSLRFKAFAGFASEKLPAQGGAPLDLSGSRIGGLVAEWQAETWRARLAWASLRMRHNLTGPMTDLQAGLRQTGLALQDPRLATAAQALDLQDRNVDYHSAGLIYEPGNLQVHLLLARFHSDAILFPGSASGVVSCGYRLGKVVPFLACSRLVSSRPTLDLGMLPAIPTPEAQALAGGVQAALSLNVSDQVTGSVGLRWDFRGSACLKVQADRIQAHQSSGLWRNIQPGWNGRATVLTAVVDVVF